MCSASDTGSSDATDLATFDHYVSALYSDVLHRPAEPAAQDYLASLLVSGVPLSEVTRIVTHSDEYWANDIIRPAYEHDLRRPASSGDVAVWISMLRAGATDEQLEATVAASDEFYNNAGANDAAWLDAAYQAILSRPADAAGEGFWLGELRTGLTRAQVALELTTSPEREPERIEANAAMLGEPYTAAAIAEWLIGLRATSDEDLLAQLAASDEYFQRSTGEAAATVPLASAAPISAPMNEAIEARAAQGNVGVMFVGDSLTYGWTYFAGSLWNQDFGNYQPMEAGVPGDTTSNLLWRLKHGDLNGVDPKVVVLMIGANNLDDGDSAAAIAGGIKANLDELRRALPDAKIVVMGVLPMGVADDPRRETIAATNAIVQTYADGTHVFFIDLSPWLLSPDGQLLPGAYYGDNTHLTAAGYQIWARAIEPLVTAWA